MVYLLHNEKGLIGEALQGGLGSRIVGLAEQAEGVVILFLGRVARQLVGLQGRLLRGLVRPLVRPLGARRSTLLQLQGLGAEGLEIRRRDGSQGLRSRAVALKLALGLT